MAAGTTHWPPNDGLVARVRLGRIGSNRLLGAPVVLAAQDGSLPVVEGFAPEVEARDLVRQLWAPQMSSTRRASVGTPLSHGDVTAAVVAPDAATRKSRRLTGELPVIAVLRRLNAGVATIPPTESFRLILSSR